MWYFSKKQLRKGLGFATVISMRKEFRFDI